jgi:hypothetical protein
VFLTVLRDSSVGSCVSPVSTTSSSDTTLNGAPAKRYVVDLPTGFGSLDPTYRIVVMAVHQGHCWILTFDSRTQAARDGNAAVDDQIVASFRFLG